MISSCKQWAGAALAGTVLLLAACGGDTAPPPEVRAVRSQVVGAAGTGDALTFTAEIHSRYETDLAFQVSGKVVSRSVDAGAVVKRGAVLARVDDQDLRIAVETAQASVAAAQAQLDRARSDESRFRDLLERGLTTRSNFLAQQTSTKTSQSQLQQAQSELQLRRQQLAYATLRADRDGIVTRTYQNAGAVVAAGQPVVALAQPAELEAVFDVAESQVDAVRAAKSMEVQPLGEGGHPVVGQVREVAPSADPQTRTYRVRATLKAPPANLKLGMIVAAVVHTAGAGSGVIAVPSTAMFQKESKPAVWVVRTDSTLELRPVSVQRYDSDRVLLSTGLTRGERIVTAGVHKLAAGGKVRLLEQQP